jgi:hypothetical protein
MSSTKHCLPNYTGNKCLFFHIIKSGCHLEHKDFLGKFPSQREVSLCFERLEQGSHSQIDSHNTQSKV